MLETATPSTAGLVTLGAMTAAGLVIAGDVHVVALNAAHD